MNYSKIKSFFTLKAKASKDLQEEVEAELEVKDPSAEKAAAILAEVEGEVGSDPPAS